MTFALIVHSPTPVPAAGTVPPINEIVVPKIETVPPLHVVDAFTGLAKVTPDGNVLEIAEGIVDSVNGKLLGLVMFIVKTETPPEPIIGGVKKLFTCAGKETSCAFTIGICGLVEKPNIKLITNNNLRNKYLIFSTQWLQ